MTMPGKDNHDGLSQRNGRGVQVRRRGHGETFPEWFDRSDFEARCGEKILNTFDPWLRVGLDRRRHVYMIFGPSASLRGWTPIMDCRDDNGQYYRRKVPWFQILAALKRAREGELLCDIVAREQEEMQEQRREEVLRPFVDACRFAGRAIKGEMEGWGRWSARDVSDAYIRQTTSQKAEPVERKIYIARG